MPARKLTDEQVADIRSYLAAHRWKGAKKAIAAKYRVDIRTVLSIEKRDYLFAHPEERAREKAGAVMMGLA
jgi:hypothetical protein